MALALLRFPEAPAAFRRGLLQALGEEQRHLALYIGRMEASGVAFGEVAVNDFFWRCLEDMRTPMDFVIRMSLTLEQANLDYSRYYKNIFEILGDTETAAVLAQVHADEIGHVRLGLHWFRQWKEPGAGDWEAFCAGLEGGPGAGPAVLGPSRAKGPEFDREVRLGLGLDAAFVDQLQLWGRSRGRPPTVWWFNPSCEEEIARGKPGHQPTAPLKALQADLAQGMLWLAAREDAVVLERPPSQAWLQEVLAVRGGLPEIADSPAALAGRKLGRLSPWGWSPEAGVRMAGLKGQLTAPGRSEWSPELAPVYAKDGAVALRRRLWEAVRDDPAERAEEWLCAPEGEVCGTVAEVEAACLRWPEAVIKARWKCSGRDMFRRTAEGWTEPRRRWLERTLAAQGAVIVEPWYRRLADFSWHWDAVQEPAAGGGGADPGGQVRLEGRGICRFVTDEAGRFLGTHLGGWQEELGEPLRRFLHGDGRDPRRLPRLKAALGRLLAPVIAPLFEGAGRQEQPVGVDAMIVETPAGPRLQPVVEINPRWTMGRLSLALAAHLHPKSTGQWRILPVAIARALPPDPVRLSGGRWQEGRVYTTDPATAAAVVGVAEIRPR